MRPSVIDPWFHVQHSSQRLPVLPMIALGCGRVSVARGVVAQSVSEDGSALAPRVTRAARGIERQRVSAALPAAPTC